MASRIIGWLEDKAFSKFCSVYFCHSTAVPPQPANNKAKAIKRDLGDNADLPRYRTRSAGSNVPNSDHPFRKVNGKQYRFSEGQVSDPNVSLGEPVLFV
jgi:hypothetical protein